MTPPLLTGSLFGGFPTLFNTPDDWTVLEEWDTRNGVGMNEMASIEAAFNGTPGGSSVVWNPDGTRITLASSGDDTIRSFICSTPWDPDTASLTATRARTNPSHLFMNRQGSQLLSLVVVGDLIENFPCSNFIIGAGAVTSDIGKNELGYIGSGDGSYYPEHDFNSFLWDGRLQFGDERCRRVTLTPNGNLDSFVLGTATDPTYTVNAAIGASKISLDGTKYYRGVGASGVELITMSTPFDPATISFVEYDIVPSKVSFFIESIFVNPDNTSEVWATGSNSGMQLARIKTNV